MCIAGLNNQEVEETRVYIATLSREELCDFIIAESQNFLDELSQVAKKTEQADSSLTPLLVAVKKDVESVLGEEYFKTLRTLKK